MQWADVGAGRRFFELFLRLIDKGILDDIRGVIAVNSEFWNLIYSLPKQHPDWSCEVIGHYLNRRLSLSLAADQPNPFDRERGTIPDSQFAESVFVESAQNAPEAYVSNVLPFMLHVMDLTAHKQNNPPWQDPIWRLRSYGIGYGTDSIILNAMVKALSSLAANQSDAFWIIAENQLINSNLKTIQYLLVRAFTANAERFADEAISYLCENPVRLETGYSFVAGNAHPAPFWATRELLETVTPHCSVDQLKRLGTAVLNFYTDYERSAKGQWFYGYPQLVLLEGITPTKRSDLANRRLEEWKRKFADTPLLGKPGRIEPPQSVESRSIGSPIPEEAASKMTDEQWLKAIARYDYADASSRFQRTGELIGGAFQLSSVLEKRVKKEPLRFAALVWLFPNDVSPYYFDAILRGLAEAEIEVDVQIALQVCLRCHQLSHRPCGRSISWLLQELPNLSWSATALDILICYALNDPDVGTRSTALSAVASLIFANKARAAYFLPFLQLAVKDSSTDIRSYVALAIIAVLNYDRNLAVTLFLELCRAEDALLETQAVEDFLYYALPTHFQKLLPILERMLISDSPRVVRGGARQACLSSLYIAILNDS